MSDLTPSSLSKTFAQAAGFKGRFVLFGVGVAGLFFPGFTCYCLLKGIASALKDVDLSKLLAELADD